MTRRHVCYLSGTRADFGLMARTLKAIHDHPDLRLSIVLTGMHLSAKYGLTEADVAATGLDIAAHIPVPLADASGPEMARNMGLILTGGAELFTALRPDMILVLGDRGEMLATACAAVHLNIPVAHVHGGERSGTIDESLRHAISKLSHLHFTTTTGARERLIRMGERPDRILVAGAPGIERIGELAVHSRASLCAELRLSPNHPTALFLFHPVVQEAGEAGEAAARLLDGLLRKGLQVVALKPNSDAGGDDIAGAIEARQGDPLIRIVTHFERPRFVSWLAAADLLVGNTSAGIIESASFGTPTLNVGSRQRLRERNANTIDVDPDERSLSEAIDRALRNGRQPSLNIYEQPNTSRIIAETLATLRIDADLLNKINAY